MKKPQVIIRRGNRFVLDEKRLYPHLRKEEDMVRTAVMMASLHYESKPHMYKDLSALEQLDKINEVFYQFLSDWGIYKGR